MPKDSGKKAANIEKKQTKGKTAAKANKAVPDGVKPKHPGGRPTKYKEEYCESIIKYFDIPPQQTVYKKTYYADGTLKSEDPIVLPVQFPTLQGFAHDIGVNVDTMIEWCKVHEKFSEAYTHAKALQERTWLTNAMGGLYNAQFAQFYGKNCLGYKDKTEVDNKVTISKLEDIL